MRIRIATFADWESIDAIGAQTFGSRPATVRSPAEMQAEAEAFRRRWEEHPHRAHFKDVPIGWILEGDDGTPVGTYTNHWAAYSWRGKFLRAAVSSAWAVLPSHRGPPALMLVSAYLRQRGVDLMINTSANEAASKIWEAMKARRVPVPALDRCTFWVLDHAKFLRAAARKKGKAVPDLLCAAAGVPLDVAMRVGRILLGAHRGRQVEQVASFDARFDAFWGALQTEYPDRLLAYRDAATLRWHFGHRIEGGTARIGGLISGGQLRAYVVLLIEETTGLGLRRARIADLQTLDRDPNTVRTLVAWCWKTACAERAAMLEIHALSPEKKAAIAKMLPLTRQLPSWPYLYKAPDPGLAAELSVAQPWDISDYDGDSSL
jgi:hypothetical protein